MARKVSIDDAKLALVAYATLLALQEKSKCSTFEQPKATVKAIRKMASKRPTATLSAQTPA